LGNKGIGVMVKGPGQKGDKGKKKSRGGKKSEKKRSQEKVKTQTESGANIESDGPEGAAKIRYAREESRNQTWKNHACQTGKRIMGGGEGRDRIHTVSGRAGG